MSKRCAYETALRVATKAKRWHELGPFRCGSGHKWFQWSWWSRFDFFRARVSIEPARPLTVVASNLWQTYFCEVENLSNQRRNCSIILIAVLLSKMLWLNASCQPCGIVLTVRLRITREVGEGSGTIFGKYW